VLNPRGPWDTLSDTAHRNMFATFAPAVQRWEKILGRAAPSPLTDKDKLNPAFVEWMMGAPEGHVTSHGLSRSKELHVLGNGVVRQQARAALGALFERITTAGWSAKGGSL
jgi:DNA (cytosine-5)-methyltransferase 1